MRFPFRFLPSQKNLLKKLSDIEKKMVTITDFEKKINAITKTSDIEKKLTTIDKILVIEKKLNAIDKILVIERKINAIENLLKESILNKNQPDTNSTVPPASEEIPSFKIENINVEKIIIQKVDYANNFGQLGIKELSGKLNIGTSYEGDISKEAAKIFKKKLDSKSENGLDSKQKNDPDFKFKNNSDSKPDSTEESSSKINFRPRKE